MACIYLIPSALSPIEASHYVPPYNIEVVKGLKYFVVENIRTARRFLRFIAKDIDIDSLTFTVLDEHTPFQEVAQMLEPVEQGHSIGVISEAGCPAVADPGADLVAVAQSKNMKVVPLVGPSSIIMALMASGFNGQHFAFLGYLPVEKSQKVAQLKEMERKIMRDGETQIFIETPYRNNSLIKELCDYLPSHLRLCVACNITASDESIITRGLDWWKKNAPQYPKSPAIYLLFK